MMLFALTPHLCAAYEALTGKPVASFRFEDAPLSSPSAVLSAVLSYLVVVHAGMRLSALYHSRQSRHITVSLLAPCPAPIPAPVPAPAAAAGTGMGAVKSKISSLLHPLTESAFGSDASATKNSATFTCKNSNAHGGYTAALEAQKAADSFFNAVFFCLDSSPRTLRIPFFIHNVMLAVFSYAMFQMILEQVSPKLVEHGMFHSICEFGAQNATLALLYYMTYLSKMYEFVDTAFLLVRGRRIPLLHWYHHSMTALLCYAEMRGHASAQWIVISLNLFVHVLMYTYYALSALGYRVWWKQAVTVLQIVQFVIDIAVCYYCAGLAMVSWYAPPQASSTNAAVRTVVAFLAPLLQPYYGASCVGEVSGALFGCLILSSYLVLFVRFFRQTYYCPKQKLPLQPAAKAPVAHEHGHDAAASSEEKKRQLGEVE